MMMKMLAAAGVEVMADNIRQADEDNPGGYFEFEPVKRTKEDASWLEDSAGKAVKMIYMLLADLPATHQYRVIFMQREVLEVLASQQVMLDRRGEKGAALPAEKLADIFDRQLAKTKQWLADQPNIDVLYLDYHRVVDDPQTQANQIRDFLGGELDIMAMATVVDPALYRQRGV